MGKQRHHVCRQWGGEVQRLPCERVREPERVGVQRGAGDARIPRAVKPIPGERKAERRHVDAELVRAPRVRHKAQQRKIACPGERFIFRAGRRALQPGRARLG